VSKKREAERECVRQRPSWENNRPTYSPEPPSFDTLLEPEAAGRPQQGRGGAYSQFKEMYANRAKQDAARKEMARRVAAAGRNAEQR
jgi:hypothetical protein